jgi:chromosome segregation ATPase
MEKDRRELEQTYLQNTRDMQERLSELEKSTKVCFNYKISKFILVLYLKELTSLKYRNEIQINELDSKFKTLTEEHQQSKEETAKLKQTITTLENELHQSAKTAGHLRTKLALVEQEVKSKQEVIQQTNDRIAIEQESKVNNIFHLYSQSFMLRDV